MLTTSEGMFMYRRIIKADDSCLFNSIGLALHNSIDEAFQNYAAYKKTNAHVLFE